MSILESLISNLNKLQRNDPYTINILDAISKEIDLINNEIIDFNNENYFDTMTWYVDVLAKQLAIKLDVNLPIEEKRSIIEGRWKSSGKSDIYLLQSIADSWKNGEIGVDFVAGKIQIKFNSIFGIPANLDNLKIELEKSKPAHLPIIYLLKYLLIQDVDSMTLEILEQQILDKFAF